MMLIAVIEVLREVVEDHIDTAEHIKEDQVQPGWQSNDDGRHQRLSLLDKAEDDLLNKRQPGIGVDQNSNFTWSFIIPIDSVFKGCNPGEFYYYLNSANQGWSSKLQLWAM